MASSITPVGKLFGQIPPDIFRLFAGQARFFYSELLAYLVEAVFHDSGMSGRDLVIETISVFIRESGFATIAPGDVGSEGDVDAVLFSERDVATRSRMAYDRLVETGWLVQRKDRYRRLVDIDTHARLLLERLIDIKSGRLRSYGGEVLQVLSLMEGARGDPENRSEGLQSAAKSARSFLNHLRGLGSAMRVAEDLVVAQPNLRLMIGTFFDDFVAHHLIEDFNRLHTKSNPFRFRSRIMELTTLISEDDILVRQMARGYVREGRSPDEAAGEALIEQDLRFIQTVFSELDVHIDIIKETTVRVEKRIANSVRYMDRIADGKSIRIREVFTALAETPIANDEVVPVSTFRMQGGIPVNGDALFQTGMKRRAPERGLIRRTKVDPAHMAFIEAQQAYQSRSVISPDRMAGYLTKAMADRRSITADELPLSTLDDYFVFERLSGVGVIGAGALASIFKIEPETGQFESPWLSCPNFKITRENSDVR